MCEVAIQLQYTLEKVLSASTIKHQRIPSFHANPFLGMDKDSRTRGREGEERMKGVQFPTDSHSVMQSPGCFLAENACASIVHVPAISAPDAC